MVEVHMVLEHGKFYWFKRWTLVAQFIDGTRLAFRKPMSYRKASRIRKQFLQTMNG